MWKYNYILSGKSENIITFSKTPARPICYHCRARSASGTSDSQEVAAGGSCWSRCWWRRRTSNWRWEEEVNVMLLCVQCRNSKRRNGGSKSCETWAQKGSCGRTSCEKNSYGIVRLHYELCTLMYCTVPRSILLMERSYTTIRQDDYT